MSNVGSKWITDDMKDSIKSVEEDDFTEFDESAESSKEDIQLAELGIHVELADKFRQKYPNKNVTYGSKITKQFFEWYVEQCSEEQLNHLKKEKLDEKLQALVPEVVKLKKVPFNDDVIVRQMSTIARLKQYLKFLYDLLGRMPDGYEFNDPEIEMIKQVKEELK